MITVNFDKLSIKPGDRILDIGCGSGRHTCAAYGLKETVVIGADLSFDDVCEARDRLRYHDTVGVHGGGTWGTLAADVTTLPFQTDAFDLVICSEVLEHIPDDKVAFKELIRIVKPGKDLVVSVPRFLPERICWSLSNEYHNANQGHVRIYKKKELRKNLEMAGVTYRGSHFAHSLHSPYWWLKCLVGPTREDSVPVNLYHRFLTWDIMKKPWITQFMDKLLNPIMGKSLVLYFKKMEVNEP